MRYAEDLKASGVALRPLLLFPGGGSPGAGLVDAELKLRRRLRQEPPGGVVWLQRNASYLPFLDAERKLVAGRRLVLDVDDAVWIHGRVTGASPLSALKGGGRKTRWLAGRADVVLAGNVYLADRLSDWAADVRVVPSVVDPAAVSMRAHCDGEEVRLGWIGSATTGPYLHDALPSLELVAQRLAPRRVRLTVLGAELAHRGMLEVESRVWSESEEVRSLAEFDIGLMPLPDNEWTRGKCAYKALSYMSAGVPVVASDVGVSAQVVEGTGAGFVVRQAQEWVDAIELLAGDLALRSRMGRSGRRGVEAEYSVRRWAPAVAAALTGR